MVMIQRRKRKETGPDESGRKANASADSGNKKTQRSPGTEKELARLKKQVQVWKEKAEESEARRKKETEKAKSPDGGSRRGDGKRGKSSSRKSVSKSRSKISKMIEGY